MEFYIHIYIHTLYSSIYTVDTDGLRAKYARNISGNFCFQTHASIYYAKKILSVKNKLLLNVILHLKPYKSLKCLLWWLIGFQSVYWYLIQHLNWIHKS